MSDKKIVTLTPRPDAVSCPVMGVVAIFQPIAGARIVNGSAPATQVPALHPCTGAQCALWDKTGEVCLIRQALTLYAQAKRG